LLFFKLEKNQNLKYTNKAIQMAAPRKIPKTPTNLQILCKSTNIKKNHLTI